MLNQIHAKFQSCELDLRSVVFFTFCKYGYMRKKINLVLIAAFPLNTTMKKVNLLKLFIFQFVNEKGKFIEIIHFPIRFTTGTWLKYAFGHQNISPKIFP